MGTRCKICCGVTTIFLILIAIVVTTLALTIFKPKDPVITLNPSGLENISLVSILTMTNITLETIVSMENGNHGSFKYKNTTGYVDYHGTVVAEVPLPEHQVPARSNVNFTTPTVLMVNKVVSSPYFVNDIGAGSLTLTSRSVVPGKVSMLKIFKFHATVFSNCNISIFLMSRKITSNCDTKLKL